MGSGITTRLALEYPVGTDPAAIPTDVQGLADGLDGLISPWSQSSSPPVSPTEGQTWWNPVATSTTFGLNYYDGISWWNMLTGPQYVGNTAPPSAQCYPGLLWVNTSFTCTQLQICRTGGGSPTWLIILPGSNSTGQALINTGSGIAWGTVAGTGVPYSGGTMTGPLILSGNPTVALGAVPKQYADAITTAWLAGVAAEAARAEGAEATLLSDISAETTRAEAAEAALAAAYPELTYAAAYIPSNVALPGSLTTTFIMDTASLGVGTWMITWLVTVTGNSTGTLNFNTADDTASGSTYIGVNAVQLGIYPGSGYQQFFSIPFIVTINSPGTIKLTVIPNGSPVSGDIQGGGFTGYTAVKIA